MKIGTIIRSKHPDVLDKLHDIDYKQVHKDKTYKHRRDKKEHLSLSYYEDLMMHDSYVRHRGAISQRRWGK